MLCVARWSHLPRIAHGCVIRQLQIRALSLASPLSAAQRVFAKSHEWILVEDGKGTVGVSNHAQESLGDIVYVEVADKGAELTRGDIVGTVESVKAASDIYTPVSGTVIEKNAELDKNPHLVNKSPYDKGELFLPETLTQP